MVPILQSVLLYVILKKRIAICETDDESAICYAYILQRT